LGVSHAIPYCTYVPHDLSVTAEFLITLSTSEVAAQCIAIAAFCLYVCLFVGLLPQQLELACIDPRQTVFAGKCSGHLQLIKFWPSHARGRGSAAGRNFWLHLTTASAQCLHLLWVLFHFNCNSSIML